MQRPPSRRSASKARRATPVSTIAIVSASREQAAALEGAVVDAVEGELLDRRAGAIGVEADLAEEDPVGPGNRALAQVDRVGAIEAIGEVAEAAAHRLGAAAGAGVDLDPGDPQSGELGGEVRRHPTLLRRRVPAQMRLGATLSSLSRLRRVRSRPAGARPGPTAAPR